MDSVRVGGSANLGAISAAETLALAKAVEKWVVQSYGSLKAAAIPTLTCDIGSTNDVAIGYWSPATYPFPTERT
jgi:hypothetical protein